MHLLLTGGGTAGHILPNLALAEHLKEHLPELKVSYICSNTNLEKDILDQAGFTYFQITTGKLRRYLSIQNFFDLFKVFFGFLQSIRILLKLKPDLVFSKGGFVALPVVFAAKILFIPIIIHESDSIPGLTTKLTGRIANQVWAEHPAIEKYFPKKFSLVNLPIRKSLLKGNASEFHKKYNFSDSKNNLLVLGGSQGAQAINDFIFNNLNTLLSDFNIFHICGAGKVKPITKPNYRQTEYLSWELANAYAWSQIVLTRAGASTISELKTLNKSAVFIPLPSAQSRGEQLLNAENFVAENKGVIIDQSQLDIETFLAALESLHKKSSISSDTNQVDLNLILNQFSNFLTARKNKS